VDKTGTVTLGKPEITNIISTSPSEAGSWTARSAGVEAGNWKPETGVA
jgi:cation transport ATPase